MPSGGIKNYRTIYTTKVSGSNCKVDKFSNNPSPTMLPVSFNVEKAGLHLSYNFLTHMTSYMVTICTYK